MNLEEPAAVTIVPTQDGGQFIEHQGQIYKNISISGTTGLRPNPSAIGAFVPTALLNISNAVTEDPATHLPRGERTGFDDLIQLRNLFRRYWDLKVDPARAASIQMVWKNGKEAEFYIVEPMSFRTSRDASSPLTATYEISLRTIQKLEHEVGRRKAYDPYKTLSSATNYISRIALARKMLISAFQLAQSSISRTVSIGQAAVNSVLTPANDVIQGLTGIITAGNRVFDIPRTTLSTLATNAVDLSVAIDNVPNNAFVTQGISSQLSILSNAYRNIARAARRIHNESVLFATQVSTTVSVKAAVYTGSVSGVPLTGGSKTYLGNTNTFNSSGVATVNSGENIMAIATRLLGDASRWKELVLLNSLRPPYISAAGDGFNVLRPNDQIIFPRASSEAPSTIEVQTRKFNNVAALNERLGRDLQIVSPQANGGVVIYDFAAGSSGDLTEVSGVPNVEQAIGIKFGVEQGTLPTHPFFGIQVPIGEKAVLRSLIAFQLNALATLLSDSRISSVDGIQARVDGNVLMLAANVRIIDQNESQTLDFSVRR